MPFMMAMTVLIGSLLVCLISGSSILFGLSAGAIAFVVAALFMGYKPFAVGRMMWRGVRDSFIVMSILLLIGSMTGVWRACGTIPFLVYYGIHLIAPQTFILFSFLLSVAVSYLIGTSIGTCGTIGIVLMVLANAGGVNLVITAGAIISGVYFGDRASPASSCANLVAYLTGTELYTNVKLMLRDCLWPMLITTLLYAIVSVFFPLNGSVDRVTNSISASYQLSFWLLLPVAVILLAPLFKIKIKYAITVSIALSVVLAVTLQGQSLIEIIRILFFGYTAPSNSTAIFNGGGMISMKNALLIMAISATFSGIIKGTNMLAGVLAFLDKFAVKIGLFPVMLLTSVPVASIACNQTLALLLEAQLLRPIYEKHNVAATDMMLDMADSTVTIAGLIPWNTACAIPLSLLGVTAAAVPWAIFLWLLPLWGLLKSFRHLA
ncbi:MAG TPA: Na+/H+ antiporter NhaC family protein [Bacillota bacterium]|nr:Na+/H+ antiporter NhaC family protein [Bacillota bacterium]